MLLGKSAWKPTLLVTPFDLVLGLAEGSAEENLGVKKGEGVRFHAVAVDAPDIGCTVGGNGLRGSAPVFVIRNVLNTEEVLLRLFVPPALGKIFSVAIRQVHLHTAGNRFEETVEVAVDHDECPPVNVVLV